MPVSELDPHPTIKIIFKGASVTRIRDGERLAQIGAIADDECHKAKITVTRIRTKDGQQQKETIFTPEDFNTDEDLFLDVEGTNRRDVQTYQKDGFDRTKGSTAHPDQEADFRYLIDLKQDILKGVPFFIDQSKLKPVFHVPRALFYSHALTDFPVRIKPASAGAPPGSQLGFAAEEIAARITLDPPDGRAVLRNGSKVILTIDQLDVQRGRSYEIEFDCVCQDDDNPLANPKSDLTLLYRAIKTATGDLAADQQLDIEKFLPPPPPPPPGQPAPPPPAGPVSPEVFCGQGNGG